MTLDANRAMDDDGVEENRNCTWCGGSFQFHDLAWCSMCGGPFHLALRMDVPVEDCGHAWLSDELEAVVFSCNRCLELQGEPTGSPDQHSGHR